MEITGNCKYFTDLARKGIGTPGGQCTSYFTLIRNSPFLVLFRANLIVPAALTFLLLCVSHQFKTFTSMTAEPLSKLVLQINILAPKRRKSCTGVWQCLFTESSLSTTVDCW